MSEEKSQNQEIIKSEKSETELTILKTGQEDKKLENENEK